MSSGIQFLQASGTPPVVVRGLHRPHFLLRLSHFNTPFDNYSVQARVKQPPFKVLNYQGRTLDSLCIGDVFSFPSSKGALPNARTHFRHSATVVVAPIKRIRRDGSLQLVVDNEKALMRPSTLATRLEVLNRPVKPETEYLILRVRDKRLPRNPKIVGRVLHLVPLSAFDKRDQMSPRCFASQIASVTIDGVTVAGSTPVRWLSNIVPSWYALHRVGETVGRQRIVDAYLWAYETPRTLRAPKNKREVISIYRSHRNIGFCVDRLRPTQRMQGISLRLYRFQF